MGNLPLRPETFRKREPIFVTHSEVKESELAGYEMWKDAQGGVWE
jgi:hypothetical protein